MSRGERRDRRDEKVQRCSECGAWAYADTLCVSCRKVAEETLHGRLDTTPDGLSVSTHRPDNRRGPRPRSQP